MNIYIAIVNEPHEGIVDIIGVYATMTAAQLGIERYTILTQSYLTYQVLCYGLNKDATGFPSEHAHITLVKRGR